MHKRNTNVIQKRQPVAMKCDTQKKHKFDTQKST